jgi:hypothetical protein
MGRRKTLGVCVDGDYLLDNSLVAIWDLGFRVWRLGSIGNMKNPKGMHYYQRLLPLDQRP